MKASFKRRLNVRLTTYLWFNLDAVKCTLTKLADIFVTLSGLLYGSKLSIKNNSFNKQIIQLKLKTYFTVFEAEFRGMISTCLVTDHSCFQAGNSFSAIHCQPSFCFDLSNVPRR